MGSGPAGLSAAGELTKSGHKVTIFEAFHAAGGVLMYGIPEFRLPKAIVQKEVDRLVADGVEIEPDTPHRQTYTIRSCASGSTRFSWRGRRSAGLHEVPGENLNGVYSANES